VKAVGTNLAVRWSAAAPTLLSVLRIVTAFLFILFGTMKLFAFPAGMHGAATVKLASQAGVAGILETVGGALLLLGLFTRPVAFIVAGEMAVAYFQVHAPKGFWPTQNGGVNAVLFCFIWLFISAAGPGPLSIDAKRRRHLL
jgi:putative oxidoreductase